MVRHTGSDGKPHYYSSKPPLFPTLLAAQYFVIQSLSGTDLDPSYDHTGLFAKGVPHKMTVIKEGQRLFLHVAGPEKAMLCHWDNRDLPPVAAGRVGLRHMYTRDARYRDLRISVRPEED
mgnify:CR=1 FL=1